MKQVKVASAPINAGVCWDLYAVDPEQAVENDPQAGFLTDLADCCRLAVFAELKTATRKCPIELAERIQVHEEDPSAFDDDPVGTDARLEPDHERETTTGAPRAVQSSRSTDGSNHKGFKWPVMTAGTSQSQPRSAVGGEGVLGRFDRET